MTDDAPRIDWSQASVEDGRLTVPWAGKPPAKWTKRLEQVVERLDRGGSGWGAIDVGRKKLRVEAVTPGSEADLRHVLESAVLQANADVPTEPEADESGSSERSEADQRMTDVFRGFAE
jgi:hypothetical protein